MHRGGGGRGGGGRGGRGGGGGGGQRWGDPAWRNAKLAEMRKARQDQTAELDVDWLEETLREFGASGDEEMILRTLFPTQDMETLHRICGERGFYSRKYGSVQAPAIVISKSALPTYRADLDPRPTLDQNVDMAYHNQQMVFSLLTSLRASSQHKHTSPCISSQQINPSSVPRSATLLRGPAESARLRAVAEQVATTAEHAEMMRLRARLPAHKQKTALLQALAKSQVVVVSGETGCGKTTQIPQFILDDAIENNQGGDCHIICTQPRRISAISVADRISQERCQQLGDTVGYQIRLESQQSPSTHLLFCTTGVLLRRLVGDGGLEGVSCVIVDEIHERGMNEDFLLIVLRDLLPKRPDLKLILMSATLNAAVFCEYFGGCPNLHIPGFTYPVKETFLEHFLIESGHRIAADSKKERSQGRGRRGRGGGGDAGGRPEAAEETSLDLARIYEDLPRHVVESLCNFNGEEVDLVLTQAAIEHTALHKPPGAILVFLTGWDDISKLHTALKGGGR